MRPAISESLFAVSKLGLGFVLLFAVVPSLAASNALAAGWMGMIGIVFALHFGIFHLLSINWRAAGINAEPIMCFPILASSLNDFWGRRWNLAFRDLAFRFVLRPLIGRIGVVGATTAVFLVSGLVHDLVISIPVKGGWGGPTIYFALQGTGMLLERSKFGKGLGLGNGLVGRLFCGLVTVCPVALLFHQRFVLQAVLPTLAAIGAV